MNKSVTGMSVNVAAGGVMVNGQRANPPAVTLALGVDRWGNWRLHSVEAALPWYRRWLVELAYWHRAPKPAPTLVGTEEFDEWDDGE